MARGIGLWATATARPITLTACRGSPNIRLFASRYVSGYRASGFDNLNPNLAFYPAAHHRPLLSSQFRHYASRTPPENPKPLQVFSPQTPSSPSSNGENDLHESPYTIPNALTLARIVACPFLGYNIIHGNYEWATGILVFGGISDGLDGWIARRWNVKSVLGSILDPAADKALMTTLVGTLAWSGMIPPLLAILIFGRDFALSMSAFYFRYISLPQPRTLRRYFDPTIPSAEVKPTQISKLNTALQLLLMGATLVNPLLDIPLEQALHLLQWTVAGTTVWSGFSYLANVAHETILVVISRN